MTHEKKTRGPYKWKRPAIRKTKNSAGEIEYRVRKGINNSRIQRRFRTLEEAEAYIASLESERVRTVANQHGYEKVPLKTLFEEWLKHKQSKLSGSRLRQYNSAFKYWKSIQHKSLEEITFQECDEVIALASKKSGRWFRVIMLCLTTINEFAKSKLKYEPNRLLQFEIDQEELDALQRPDANKVIYVKSEDIEKFLDDVRKTIRPIAQSPLSRGVNKMKKGIYLIDINRPTYLAPFCQLAIATGMRIGEMLALTWDKIDFEKETIQVEGTIAYAFDVTSKVTSTILKDTTKSKTSRELPLNDDAIAALKELHERWVRITTHYEMKDNNFVFVRSKRGGKHFSKHKALCYETVAGVFRNAMKKIGVKGITPHKLRHTFGTAFIEKVGKKDGNAKEYARQFLGHTSDTMTSRYVHIVEKYKISLID